LDTEINGGEFQLLLLPPPPPLLLQLRETMPAAAVERVTSRRRLKDHRTATVRKNVCLLNKVPAMQMERRKNGRIGLEAACEKNIILHSDAGVPEVQIQTLTGHAI
jgi:hypothetical protein